MTSKFKILISSDIGYDELCVEIYFQDEFVGIITQEKGLENLEIEIHPKQDNKCWVFKFSEFNDILKFAKKVLLEMRRSS